MNRLILAAVLVLVCGTVAEARCHRSGGLFRSRTVSRSSCANSVVAPAPVPPAKVEAKPAAPAAAPVVMSSGCASGSCASSRTVTRSRFHFFSR